METDFVNLKKQSDLEKRLIEKQMYEMRSTYTTEDIEFDEVVKRHAVIPDSTKKQKEQAKLKYQDQIDWYGQQNAQSEQERQQMNLQLLKNISRLNGYKTFMAEVGVKSLSEIPKKTSQIIKKLQITLQALEKTIKEKSQKTKKRS